jgi:hypothetical protein
MKFTVGKFSGTIQEGGYPVWINLYHEGRDVHLRFDHKEIMDLEHVVKKLRRDAASLLPGQENEI